MHARTPLAVAVALLCAALPAGCGSASAPASGSRATATAGSASGSPHAVGGAPATRDGSASTPAASRAHRPGSRQTTPATAPGAARPHTGNRVQVARRLQDNTDESNPTGARPVDPCRLVSDAELRAITGRSLVRKLTAPLGPTCVVSLRGTRAVVTIAVESAGFAQLVRQIRHRQRIVVAGRRAYCGELDLTTLYVPLSRGRVLHIAAACPQAQAIATAALARLRA